MFKVLYLNIFYVNLSQSVTTNALQRSLLSHKLLDHTFCLPAFEIHPLLQMVLCPNGKFLIQDHLTFEKHTAFPFVTEEISLCIILICNFSGEINKHQKNV